MLISDTLNKAIENNDMISIRSSFHTIILSDPAFATEKFDQTLNYVKRLNINGLFDEHDGEELLPEAEWDHDYFDLIASKLQDNFSEERIKQLKNVAKKLSVSDNNLTIQEKDINEINRKKDSDKIEDKYNSTSTNVKKSEVKYGKELGWIGAIGVAVATAYVLHRIFKRGK
ncbi:MAG: hypothetical protein J6D52_07275 [Clostridia bacterium]|nr:hypothetical protein [Clostridia bacterium]